MKLYNLKDVINDKYVLDINYNPIIAGDIVAVYRRQAVAVETVKTVYPDIGKFESISNHLYIAKNCLNISKMYYK